MILTIALLLMIGCMFGLIILYRRLFIEHLRTHVRLSELKAMIASMRHDLAIDRQGMDERFDELGRELMISEGEADYLRATYADQTQKLIKDEHQKTRKDIQDTQYEQHKLTRRRISEVKMRLADEERQDQQEKAKARREAKKKAGASK